ncbi:carbohydrate ABC transporter permease [Paenarthrobacter sp. Z7-10]|uniref:carbohydrate ABC transporter permease n=1 Tax=Paenarthrobacter sp. Z7-10 TaxID=2787635 RepID=UPI0022A8FBE8|nr:carbohydrate ABC transporter permease [Paenarthrobacter sp. Z7-10]MCZ2402886.1 carbohydrate ABC transporter permease [Paenarthrobacter sp. Z7-10]
MSSSLTQQLAIPRARLRASQRRKRGSNVGAHIILITGSVIMIFPFLWQIIMSLSTNSQVMSVPPTFWPNDLQWHNFADVFTAMPFMSQFWVSVSITIIRTIGQLALCSLAGYAFARMRFPFKGLILGIILAILMVPSQVYLIPQYQIIQGLGWLNSTAGIVAPGIFSAFGTFMMRQFFLGLPDELEEAARLDGCNPFQTFWKVMLPLAKPGLSALAIITVLWSWNDLLWPLVVSTYAESMPLSAGLATLQGQNSTNYPVLMAASLMASAPVLILFLVMQRRVIDGIAFSGMK